MERNEQGLTLIEVVVAMLILAVALLGLAAAFPLARLAVHEGGQLSTAAALASDVVEQMKQRRFDDITTGNFPNQNYNAIGGFPSYRRTVAIVDTTVDGVLAYKQVTVTVYYKGQGGVEQNVPVMTVITRYQELKG